MKSLAAASPTDVSVIGARSAPAIWNARTSPNTSASRFQRNIMSLANVTAAAEPG